MKYCIKYFCLIFTIFILFGCKEEFIGQYPVDDISPAPVTGVHVENINGGAIITYNTPDDTDILYVQAKYTLPNGEKMVTKSSIFDNQLTIKGFRKSQPATIEVTTIDRSQNVSEPIKVDIHPLDSPIFPILNSFVLREDFGGFNIKWENPFKEEVVISIYKRDETTNEAILLENIYSSQGNENRAIMGLDSISAIFMFTIRDIYNNTSDTLKVAMKPYFQIQIPKEGFRIMPLSSWYELHSYGGGGELMWDNIYNEPRNVYYIRTGNPEPPFFTFDMGVRAKLARFRLWQRVDFLFSLHNPKTFELYGTNDSNLAQDAQTLNWEQHSSWIKIMDGKSKRPGGVGDFDPITNLDIEYAHAGEEFRFDPDTPPVRYIRFKVLSTWGGSTGVHINELTFWGEIDN